MVLVKDLIKRPLISVKPDVLLKEAIETMSRENIGFLVIVEDDKAVGVLSERDVIHALAKGIDPNKTKVSDVMKTTIYTVNINDDVRKAASLMRKYNVRHLVVVDDKGKPVGVLSIRDLLREEVLLKKIESLKPEELQEWWFG